MTESLVAWLYGTPVMTLKKEANARISFSWRHEGIERWRRGSRVLSLALPLDSPTNARDDRAMEFFSNLLPDGPVLIAMAQLVGASPFDTFALLSHYGSECAGAVILLNEGQRPTDAATWGSESLSLDDIAAAVDDLPATPFGVILDRGWTPSLAGFQGKLLLGRTTSGQWTRPTNGAPSTWILKPDGEHRMAENEHTCLRLAQRSGLHVPETELLDVRGTKTLAIQRYDRCDATLPTIRVHQEDGCQATNTPPQQKYEYAGGPSLKDLAWLLRDYGDAQSTQELLRRVTFNVAIGNADAHAKNFSFLHDSDDEPVTVAPVYDVLCTLALEQRPNAGGVAKGASTRMGQFVNGVGDILDVNTNDLIAEGTHWGLRSREASDVVHEMLQAIDRALANADGDSVTLSVVESRLRRLVA